MKRVALAIVAIAVVVLTGSMLLLNSNWLKSKLEEKAAENGADVRAKSLSFSPFQGKATLSGVEFNRGSDTSEISVVSDTALLKVRVLPLMFRSLHIDRIELVNPKITTVVQRKSEKKSGGSSIVDKLKDLANKKLEEIQKRGEEQETEDKKRIDWKPKEFEISHLIIKDGVVDYTATRQEKPPFHVRVSNIDYTARDISLDSLYRFLYGADVHAEINLKGKASLDKNGSKLPATFALTGITLESLSRYLDLDSALIITAGKMDVKYRIDAEQIGKIRFNVTIQGMEWKINREAVRPKLLLRPLEQIVNYVRRRDGNLQLTFDVDRDRFDFGANLEDFTTEFWDELWNELLQEIDPAKVEDLIEQGTKKALDFLKQKMK